MVERLGEMRKGRRERIEKGSRERIEKREREQREDREKRKRQKKLNFFFLSKSGVIVNIVPLNFVPPNIFPSELCPPDIFPSTITSSLDFFHYRIMSPPPLRKMSPLIHTCLVSYPVQIFL